MPFPFTDLSAAKVRPALVVSQPDSAARDVVVCFITSKQNQDLPHALALKATAKTGLKVPSVVRFDRIATLEKRIVLGELGRIEPRTLRSHRRAFFAVFGF